MLWQEVQLLDFLQHFLQGIMFLFDLSLCLILNSGNWNHHRHVDSKVHVFYNQWFHIWLAGYILAVAYHFLKNFFTLWLEDYNNNYWWAWGMLAERMIKPTSKLNGVDRVSITTLLPATTWHLKLRNSGNKWYLPYSNYHEEKGDRCAEMKAEGELFSRERHPKWLDNNYWHLQKNYCAPAALIPQPTHTLKQRETTGQHYWFLITWHCNTVLCETFPKWQLVSCKCVSWIWWSKLKWILKKTCWFKLSFSTV